MAKREALSVAAKMREELPRADPLGDAGQGADYRAAL